MPDRRSPAIVNEWSEGYHGGIGKETTLMGGGEGGAPLKCWADWLLWRLASHRIVHRWVHKQSRPRTISSCTSTRVLYCV